MENKIKLLVSVLGENRIKKNIDLSEHLQTGLGGNAEGFYIATTTQELIQVIELCKELRLNFLVFGSGSKMAISANGISGLAIKNRSSNLKISGVKGKVSKTGIGIEEAFLEADSGVSLVKLAEFANQEGLAGFDVLKTTIGTIGGSFYILPILQDKTHQVQVLTKMGTIKIKQAVEVLKEDIILSVVFELKARIK